MHADLERDAEELTHWLEWGCLQAALVRRIGSALAAADDTIAASRQWEQQARTIFHLLREAGRDNTLTDFSLRVMVLALVDPLPLSAEDLSRTAALYPRLFTRSSHETEQ